MATLADRASIIGIGFPPLAIVVPSADVTQGSLQTLMNIYSGILALPVVVPVAPTFIPVYSAQVTFKKVNVGGLIQQLDGPERNYPVYRFGSELKFERPETPGNEYRWARDNDNT
mgnify:CR=1 FL=1|tara:strand:+ start:18 stop:362 length:345 start_codon:yes stop_codon:yes gene_type:complete